MSQAITEEWLKKIQQASEASSLKKPDEKEELKNKPEGEKKSPAIKNKKVYVVAAFILSLGLLYRLFFIFKVSVPENAGVGWYGDTYHHWQIGYLTFTTGLKHEFLRLWDLKGMEYFWGLFHPLLLSIIFWITGITNIVISRLISVFFGLGSLYILFLLAYRHWGGKVAFAALFFGSLFPIAVFNDASGTLEPIGVFFLLLGIYFWPVNPLLTGIAFAVSTMVRAEAWLFSAGLIIAILFTKKRLNDKKAIVCIIYLVMMLLYMKYLLDKTGNAIYPVWWNFLANGAGAWAGEDKLTALQMSVKPMLMLGGVVSFFTLLFIFLKKPKGMLLLLLGFGNIFFVTAFMGFGHYIAGWEWWFPVIRFFVFPYLFITTIFFIFLEKLKIGKSMLWTFVFVFFVLLVTLASQWTWYPIMQRFSVTATEWERSVVWGKTLGRYYEGGTVLFPEGDPNFTYTTVAYGGVKGENILGEMFDPFFYIGEDEAFNKYNKHRKEILSWISKNNIRLAVIRTDSGRYDKLIHKEANLFKKVSDLERSAYQIWRVYPERIKASD